MFRSLPWFYKNYMQQGSNRRDNFIIKPNLQWLSFVDSFKQTNNGSNN